MHTYETGIIGGGRNEADTTNNYTATKEECNCTVLDGVAAVAVSAGAPAYLMGIFVMSGTPTVTIAGMKDQLGAAKSIVFTGAAATFYNFHASRCETSLTVTSSVDDVVAVLWRPIL